MKAWKPCLAWILTAWIPAAHAQSIDELKAKAEEGDAVAQVQLAVAFASGDGVTKDPKEAATWYALAAEQGDAQAQWMLGTLYLGGRGLRRDNMAAAKWFGMAAEQGRADAQLQLARMHITGSGVQQDDVAAYKWAKLAEKQGNKAAIKTVRFLQDRMDEVDLALAATWIEEFEAQRAAAPVETGVPLVAPPLEVPPGEEGKPAE